MIHNVPVAYLILRYKLKVAWSLMYGISITSKQIYEMHSDIDAHTSGI